MMSGTWYSVGCNQNWSTLAVNTGLLHSPPMIRTCGNKAWLNMGEKSVWSFWLSLLGGEYGVLGKWLIGSLSQSWVLSIGGGSETVPGTHTVFPFRTLLRYPPGSSANKTKIYATIYNITNNCNWYADSTMFNMDILYIQVAAILTGDSHQATERGTRYRYPVPCTSTVLYYR